MIVVDTSGLLAAKDESQPQHVEVADVLRDTAEELLLSPLVLAECDYMLATRLGATAAREFLGEVAAGAYQLVTSTPVMLRRRTASSTDTAISPSGSRMLHWSSSQPATRPRGYSPSTNDTSAR